VDREKLIKEAEEATTESSRLDFKRTVEDSKYGQCSIIKDIIAMANSGGGILVFGCDDNGNPTDDDVPPLLLKDQSELTNQIEKYTSRLFPEINFVTITKNGISLKAITIDAVDYPIVFTKDSVPKTVRNKPHFEFKKGEIYYRHGTKSEPGNSFDIRHSIDLVLEKQRKEWLSDIAKVVEAPVGSTIKIVQTNDEANASIADVRITNDPTAQGFRIDYDERFPYIQRDVVEQVNNETNAEIKSYDITALRNQLSKEFLSVHFSRIGYPDAYPRYSKEFVKWLIESYRKNSRFFYDIRNQYRSNQYRKNRL